jgi:hypothetical protein
VLDGSGCLFEGGIETTEYDMGWNEVPINAKGFFARRNGFSGKPFLDVRPGKFDMKMVPSGFPSCRFN